MGLVVFDELVLVVAVDSLDEDTSIAAGFLAGEGVVVSGTVADAVDSFDEEASMAAGALGGAGMVFFAVVASFSAVPRFFKAISARMFAAMTLDTCSVGETLVAGSAMKLV